MSHEIDLTVEKSSPSRLYIYVIGIILIFSSIMRFKGLDTESMWLDELTSLWAINGDSWEGAMSNWLSMVGMGTWLMYFWKSIVGDSDFALRSISVITGVILVFLVAEFTRRHHDEKAAIIASSMISISHLAILYSQEFRPYMFTTTFLWIALILIRSQRRLNIFEMIICTALLSFVFLVHYVAGLAVVLGLIADFIIRIISFIRTKYDSKITIERNLKKYLKSDSGQRLQICFSLATLAIFMLDKIRYDSGNTGHSMWINDTPRRPVVTLFDYFVAFDIRGGGITDLAEALWYFVLLTPLILFLFRKISRKKQLQEETEWFIWAVGAGSMIVVVLYSILVRNLWVSRYFVFSMPAWYILFGISISRVIDLGIELFKRFNKDVNLNVGKNIAIFLSTLFILNSGYWLVYELEYYEQQGRSDFKGMSIWLDENVDENQDDVFIISQPYARYWDLYLDRMGSDVEIDTHTRWGDVIIGQVISILDDEPSEVIHIRGHKKNMWGYEDLSLVLNASYELSESHYFIEGQIDVYRLQD
ncbi:MAG: hypothetical protein CMB72_02545 [Euryarchaeota archaeon]|nr:hypothetical protein [Euryarchaeota archaeon]